MHNVTLTSLTIMLMFMTNVNVNDGIDHCILLKVFQQSFGISDSLLYSIGLLLTSVIALSRPTCGPTLHARKFCAHLLFLI